MAAATGRYEDEGWRVRKDGSLFWANVVITALRTPSGTIDGFLKITRDLTERRRAQEQLRESEERFRLMVESITDYAIYMMDLDGRINYWSEGAERILGYPSKEILGQHISRFYLSQDVQVGKPLEDLRIAADLGNTEDEGWRVRRDGSMFWANTSTAAVRDMTGLLRGYARVMRDLTMTYQRATSSLADGALFLGPDGRAFACNSAAGRCLDLPESQLTGNTLLHPPANAVREDGSAFQDEDYPPFVTMSTGTGCRDVVMGVVTGNAHRWLSVSSEPLGMDAYGKPSGVSVSFHDITKLKASEESARRGEELFRSLVEASEQIVWIAGPDGDILDVSTRFESLSGLRRWDARQWQWLDLIIQGDRESTLVAWKHAIASRQPFELEFRMRIKDGSYRFFHVHGLPLQGPNGKIREWVGTFADVHERRLHEQELERKAYLDALTGLANRSLLRDRLSHSIAHAFRNGSLLAVLFLDLDNFKEINDRLGHPPGDEILQIFATRLRSLTRAEDTVARIGGDEFVVVLSQIVRSEDVLTFHSKLRAGLDEPIPIGGEEIHVSASVGVALYPRDGEDEAELLSHADTAMYRVKDQGRNGIAFYSQEIALSNDGRKAANTQPRTS